MAKKPTASNYTRSLTKVLRKAKKEERVICQTVNDCIYVGTGYFIYKLTAEEYEQFARPALAQDAGNWALIHGELETGKSVDLESIATCSQKEFQSELHPLSFTFTTDFHKVATVFLDEYEDFGLSVNQEYWNAVRTEGATFESAGKYKPLFVKKDYDWIAMILPMRLPDAEQFARLYSHEHGKYICSTEGSTLNWVGDRAEQMNADNEELQRQVWRLQAELAKAKVTAPTMSETVETQPETIETTSTATIQQEGTTMTTKSTHYTQTLKKVLRREYKEGHIACEKATDGIYISTWTFICKLTEVEYATYVYPVVSQDAGNWTITNGVLSTDHPLHLTDMVAKDLEARRFDIMRTPIIFVDTERKTSKASFYSEEGAFATGINVDYLDMVRSDSVVYQSAGMYQPVMLWQYGVWFASIMPARLDAQEEVALQSTYAKPCNKNVDLLLGKAQEALETIRHKNELLKELVSKLQTELDEVKAITSTISETIETKPEAASESKPESIEEQPKATSESIEEQPAAASESIKEQPKGASETKPESIEEQPAAASETKPETIEPVETKTTSALDVLVSKLEKLSGVAVKVKGAQTSSPVIWLSGNTDAHKKAIQQMGGRWANKKAAWYIKATSQPATKSATKTATKAVVKPATKATEPKASTLSTTGTKIEFSEGAVTVTTATETATVYENETRPAVYKATHPEEFPSCVPILMSCHVTSDDKTELDNTPLTARKLAWINAFFKGCAEHIFHVYEIEGKFLQANTASQDNNTLIIRTKENGREMVCVIAWYKTYTWAQLYEIWAEQRVLSEKEDKKLAKAV